MQKTKRIITGSWNGNGEILRSGEHFADCAYQVQLEQEIIESESSQNEQEVPGSAFYSGTVTIDPQELLKPGVLQGMNSGEVLTLHLANESLIRAYFNPILEENKPANGVYKIMPVN
jgi:hypothetical protein